MLADGNLDLDLGLGYTFLRPNLYFQGLLAFREMIVKEGKFFAPIGGAHVSAVDVRDIALVAAAALTEDGHSGKIYTITGPATPVKLKRSCALAIWRPTLAPPETVCASHASCEATATPTTALTKLNRR